jgi:ABC-type cobalt transport system substrate-binding protein
MATSGGEDQTLRRWRITLTIAAWLLIVQSGLAVLTGLVGMMTASMADPTSFMGQLGPLMDRRGIALFDQLLRQLVVANQVQAAANTVLLAGAIGLLLRKKWGWYIVVGVHLAGAAASIIWAGPMLKPLFAIAYGDRAGEMSMLMGVLMAAVPAIVIAFLMVKGIVSQFEKRSESAPSRP